MIFDFSLLDSVYGSSAEYFIKIIEHNGLPGGHRLLGLSETDIYSVSVRNQGGLGLSCLVAYLGLDSTGLPRGGA